MVFASPIRNAIVAAVAVLGGALACEDVVAEQNTGPAQQTIYEQRAATHARFGDSGVSAVSQRFLLMKKGYVGCAVRFTSYRREGERKPSSFWSSGGDDTYAEYDWYFQGDGSFDFSKPNIQSGHGKLHKGPDVRLGHGLILWVPKGTSRAIKCETFSVWWGYPMNFAFFSFSDTREYPDPDLQLAPTKWKEIRDVDFANSRLRWTGLRNAPKQEIWIPVEELP